MDDANDNILESMADRSGLKQQLRRKKIQNMDQNLHVVSARSVRIVGHRPRLGGRRGSNCQWQYEVHRVMPWRPVM